MKKFKLNQLEQATVKNFLTAFHKVEFEQEIEISLDKASDSIEVLDTLSFDTKSLEAFGKITLGSFINHFQALQSDDDTIEAFSLQLEFIDVDSVDIIIYSDRFLCSVAYVNNNENDVITESKPYFITA